MKSSLVSQVPGLAALGAIGLRGDAFAHKANPVPDYSPILSIFTAAFELAACAWCMRAGGRRPILNNVALTLLLLAGYQLIEVAVCHAPHDPFWARLAFADVVWLPPLGLVLLHRLAVPTRAVWGWLVRLSLAGAAFLSVWVFADPRFVTGTVCKTVIAIYLHPTNALEAYGAFYHLGLWSMIIAGIQLARTATSAVDRAHAADFAMGTVAFVVLALTTATVFPDSREATPSVMCHYAIVLAVFMVRIARREHRSGTNVAASPQKA